MLGMQVLSIWVMGVWVWVLGVGFGWVRLWVLGEVVMY